MVLARFIQARDQVVGAGACGAATDRELAGEFGLSGGGQRGAFFMTHADPLDAFVLAHGFREGIERIADNPEYLAHADGVEGFNEHLGDGGGHGFLGRVDRVE